MFIAENLKVKDKSLALFFDSLDKTGNVPVFFTDGKYLISKSFCDVHVHFREPGASYKETIASGSRAAARGGYTTVCTMPNLNPSPFSLENLKVQTDIIKKDAVIEVIPYGRITKDTDGSLADMEDMKDMVCAFSDDGKGVQEKGRMEEAMIKAKSLNKVITAHCEDNSLLKKGGCIHDGHFAKENGFTGISSESEYKQIERDIELLKKTGARYHVCHISAKESVALIREAKKEGLDITCETGPHYLVLTEDDLKDEGRFKMNPPLRSEEDRAALIEGIKDGTIDMIATDHAPHSTGEKAKGLASSSFGIVGIETAFPILYTNLVKNDIISLEKLISLLTDKPRERFNIKDNGYTVFELKEEYKIDPGEFLSKGKSTPFEGSEVYGKCILTVMDGKVVYKDTDFIE
ncbi:MAG: dihydroorotase [Clostridia bacterium]|nr:dihydroorotase [Clostridia bacterium]